MLELTIGNTYVDTQNIEIPVVLRSPLLTDGKGSYLFNFSLPASDSLKREMGFFHRPGRYGTSHISKPLKLKFGPLSFSGTAKVQEAGELSYEVSCPIENGLLAQMFRDKNLKDIDLGGLRNPDSIHLRIQSALSIDKVVYGTTTEEPVENYLLFDDIEVNVAGELNAGTIFTSSENNSVTIIFDLSYADIRSESVRIRLMKNGLEHSVKYFLKSNTHQIFLFDLPVTAGDQLSWQLYSIGDPVINFTLNAGSTIRIYHPCAEITENATIFYPNTDYVLFPFQNPKLLSKLPDDAFMIDHWSIKEIYEKYFPVINYYADNRFPLGMSGTIENETFSAFNLYNPFPYLAYVIKRIAQTFDIKIINNVFEENDLKQLIIFNLFAENSFITSELIQPNNGFNLAEHVPDVALSDYWINLCRLLGITYDYDSILKTLRLKNIKDIANPEKYKEYPGIFITNPTLNADPYNGYRLIQEISSDDFIKENFKSLEGLTLKGSVYTVEQLYGFTDQKVNDCWYVVMRKAYYCWNYDEELVRLNWVFHSNDFFFVKEIIDKTISDNTLEIKTNISPLMMRSWPGIDNNICAEPNRFWLIPETHQPGNFDGLPSYFNADYSKSLLFYHGLRQDSKGNLYPLASNDIYDYAGDPITFDSVGGDPAYTHQLSLRWDGPNGLYERRYKKWIELLTRSRGFFNFTSWLTPLQLSQIDWFEWYSAPGFKMLIKEIKFTIYHDKLSISDVDVLVK